MSERINGYKVTIYPEGKGYTGVIDLGFHPDGRRNRPKRKACTKELVRDKLTELAGEISTGVTASNDDTVLQVATDFVTVLAGQKLAPSTMRNHRKALRHIKIIGHIKVRELKVKQVEMWLCEIAKVLSTGTLRKAHGLLSRAIDHAMLDDDGLTRNVSRMAKMIEGDRTGRESKSLTRAQVEAILAIALIHRFAPYVVLAITSGLRVDELNALTWADLDLDATVPTVSVIRADRTSGDTKTPESKRALELGAIAVTALKVWRTRQREELLVLGRTVDTASRVFTEPDGTPYRAKTARTDFRDVLRTAGVPNPEGWTTRETRHTFVSIMSNAGVNIEDIADMCGHTVKVLLKYYRKQLRPVIQQSANVINNVFGLAA